MPRIRSPLEYREDLKKENKYKFRPLTSVTVQDFSVKDPNIMWGGTNRIKAHVFCLRDEDTKAVIKLVGLLESPKFFKALDVVELFGFIQLCNVVWKLWGVALDWQVGCGLLYKKLSVNM